MHHSLVMRFSAYMNPYAGDMGRNQYSNMWYTHVVSKGGSSRDENLQIYKDYLYSEDRMSVKFAAFENLFLPSLRANTESRENWTAYIYITEAHMPAVYVSKLRGLVGDIRGVEIVNLESEPYDDSEYLEHLESRATVGSDWSIIWVGDDDAMSPIHLDLLENEARERSEPFIYTMPRLQRVTLDAEHNIVKGSMWTCPNVHGLALSGVRVNPIKLGAHYNIEKNHPDLAVVKDFDNLGGMLFCDKQHTASRRDLQGRHFSTKSR